jgi:hypothetical protein
MKGQRYQDLRVILKALKKLDRWGIGNHLMVKLISCFKLIKPGVCRLFLFKKQAYVKTNLENKL